MTWRVDRIGNGTLWLTANLSLWLLVVLLYSHSIGLWHLLVGTLGKSIAGGAPVALAGLLIALLAVLGRREVIGMSWPWAAAAAAVFVAGLLSTDPAFPAKRIHVPEYFALTLLVYWSCRPHLPRPRAVWGAVALTIALGSVDEILQGAMATRTFGMRDVGTNALGALSAGHCLQSLAKGAAVKRPGGATLIYAGMLLAGLALLLLGANAYKGAEMPVWIYLPALSTLPLATIERTAPGARLLDALAAVCAGALLLVGGIDALDIDFR